MSVTVDRHTYPKLTFSLPPPSVHFSVLIALKSLSPIFHSCKWVHHIHGSTPSIIEHYGGETWNTRRIFVRNLLRKVHFWRPEASWLVNIEKYLVMWIGMSWPSIRFWYKRVCEVWLCQWVTADFLRGYWSRDRPERSGDNGGHGISCVEVRVTVAAVATQVVRPSVRPVSNQHSSVKLVARLPIFLPAQIFFISQKVWSFIKEPG